MAVRHSMTMQHIPEALWIIDSHKKELRELETQWQAVDAALESFNRDSTP